MTEVPKQCKYIKTCTKSIEEAHFEHICNVANWIHCDWIRPEELRAYQKTPREWLEKEDKK